MGVNTLVDGIERAINDVVDKRVMEHASKIEQRLKTAVVKEVEREARRFHVPPLDPHGRASSNGLTYQAAFEISEKVREFLLHPSMVHDGRSYRIPYTPATVGEYGSIGEIEVRIVR